MGHNVFVSYKYADSNVQSLNKNGILNDETTVRTYVDVLSQLITDVLDYKYKGEYDNEDLSMLSDDTIWESLKDKIYDSTLTIIMISSGMRDPQKRDRNQWIPWEISYSLKEISRRSLSGTTKTSHSNALLAIVLPDKSGRYDYFIENKTCCPTQCKSINTDFLFRIIRKNMFNLINVHTTQCNNNRTIYPDNGSFIVLVTWKDFLKDPKQYINEAYDRLSKIAQYEITKELNQ